MQEALNLKWDYVKWTALEDIVTALGSSSARYVGLVSRAKMEGRILSHLGFYSTCTSY